MSKWIDFVKDWAKKHNMTYAKALKDPKMKEAYKSPKMKGGATKEQRANAVMLRTRDGITQPTLGKLNALTHSADTKTSLAKYKDNPYVDYTEDPLYVDDPSKPTPVDIINNAFNEYFTYLEGRPVKDLIANPEMFPEDGFFIPDAFMPRWRALVDKIKNYVPADDRNAEAFWTDPNDFRTKMWAELDYQVRVENPKPETDKETRRINILALKEFMETEILPAVRAYNKKYGVDNGFNPEVDYSKASGKDRASKKRFIEFPLKYAGLIIQGRGMKTKHL